MKTRSRALTVACALALGTLAATPAIAGNPTHAGASVGATSTETAHLATRYADFAGSQSNAAALVAGLRSGSAFVLSSTDAAGALTQTTITPSTKAMGYGEVNIALSLAKAELAKNGITNPTPQQIEAALNGGVLTTANGSVPLHGVLAMRQQGQGWGQIANGLGYKLGDLTNGSATALASATTSESGRLASRYVNFAGSQSNAAALVAGLRSGSAFVLSSTDAAGALTQTTITPSTKAMGYGEVNIALSLAKAELAKNGITNPTPQQIEAALNGGVLTTANGSVPLHGVLAMRQQGQGWGQIANGLGYKLGDLVSASETGNSQAGMHGQAGVHGSVDTGTDASANAAANASLHATLPARVNLPQRPNVPAVVRPNVPVHVGIGAGGG